MTNTLYAQKLGMTEAYVGETRRGVTLLQVLPMQVAAQKGIEKNGYETTQVVFGETTKKPNQALAGHLKKAKVSGRYLREIAGLSSLELGAGVDTSALTQAGAQIDVSGISKGKGLAGVVKRHHFAGGPRTHGQSDRLRRAGSIGQGTTPGRVYKGKKMSGRMGNDQVTVKNTTILSFDPTNNHLIVAGPVPGHTGSLVKVVVTQPAPASFPAVTLTKQNIVTPPPAPAPESETV